MKTATILMLLITPLLSRSDDALTQTKNVLNNPQAREQQLQSSELGKKTQETINELTGGDRAHENEIYGVASSIFQKMVEQSNGDPAKLQQMIMEAQKNPEGFGNQLSPEDKQKIEELSRRMPAAQMKPSLH